MRPGIPITICMRYGRFALLLALMLAALIPLVTPARAAGATQYVDSTFDGPSSATDCTNPISGCSLRDALHAAAAGDTVALSPGNNPYLVVLTAGQLTIAQDVTIQGRGLLTVDGIHGSRVLEVDAGTVLIDGVTIQHGEGTKQGAGINQMGGNLTLTNCLVTNNIASGASGAIGGGMYTQSNLTLTNTTVSNNYAIATSRNMDPSAVGGGIFQYSGGTLTVSGSTISGNTTQSSPLSMSLTGGAGIYSLSTFSLTNSTVRDNQSTGSTNVLNGGGGIVSGGNTTITNTTIAGNSAGVGGGINNGGTLTLTSTTLTGNSARGNGGGLYSSVGNPVPAPVLTDTLIALNTDVVGNTDVFATVSGTSASNLIGNGTGLVGISTGSQGNQIGTSGTPLDPKLDPNGLRANGSTGAATVALLPNSPAIDASLGCPVGVTTDARGRPRINGCDIGAFEYQPVTPTLTNATAPATGGSVVFHGTGFQVSTIVAIGGNPNLTAAASAVSSDGTQMTLMVPAHGIGTLQAIVSNPGGLTALGPFSYVPLVSAVSPPSGGSGGGVSVAISGAGFGTDTGQVSVRFGMASATVKSVSDTLLVVMTPAGSGSVDVTVTVSGLSGTLPNAYTYGVVSALPSTKATGGTPGNPNALPVTRPAGAAGGGAPNVLPVPRP